MMNSIITILAALIAMAFIATGAIGQSASNAYETVRRCEQATSTPERAWCGGSFFYEHDDLKVDRHGNVHLIPQDR